MITKENEPIMRMSDGGYIVQHGAYRYVVRDTDTSGAYKKAEIEAYIKDHQEALVEEPKPAEPNQEELRQRAINEARAYLSSTDWYVICFAETGKEIPEDVRNKRGEARELLN